jgi:mono/diheme cytochrome c family protein
MRPAFRACFRFAGIVFGVWSVLSMTAAAYAQIGIAAAPGKAQISAGEFEFRLYCSQCHGMEAIGNGPVAPVLKTRPANLRMLTKKNGGIFPEQEIHDFIDGTKQIAAHGNREMPIWGLAFQYREGTMPHSGVPPLSADEVDQRIDRLVDYIRSIQAPY